MKTLNKKTKNRTIMKYHTVTSLKLIITLVFLCGISIKGWTQETSLSATDENELTWNFKTNLTTTSTDYHKAYDVIPADPSQLIGPIEVPCSLEVDGVSYPVLRMGKQAFNGCTQMTSLTMPKTLNSLSNNYIIFDGCTGLKKLDLSKTSINSFPYNWFASNQANTQAVGLEEIWLPKVTARNPYTINLFRNQTYKKVYFHEDQPKCTSSCFSALAALTGTVKNCVFYFPNEGKYPQYHPVACKNSTIISVGSSLTYDVKKEYKFGQSVDIPVKTKHRLENFTDNISEVVEIQMGDVLDENDIIRFEDVYNRITNKKEINDNN